MLLLFSFSSLNVNEYGLDYSSISKTVHSEPYVAGFHFLGVGHSFFRFPRTVQTIEFSSEHTATSGNIRSRTSDGLEVNLEISYQYKVIFEKLYDLYSQYGMDYYGVFEKIGIDVLTELATKYTAYDFFVNRQKIGQDMQAALNKVYAAKCYSTVDFFQLRSVDLPDLFEQSIQLSEVKKQDILKAKAERNKIQVMLETLRKTALFQRNVTLNVAEGQAESILAQNLANAKSFLLVQNSMSSGYGSLKKKLGMANSNLVDYVRAKAFREFNDTNLVMSIDSFPSKKV